MKRKIYLLLFTFALFFGISFTPKFAFADALGTGNCASTDIDTAIGCVPVLVDDNGTSLMGTLLGWAIGVGGGIAFLLIVYAGFMIMTSSGNPERLKAGQELLTSAISGLVLLIFSIFVLNLIGVEIFRLDKFGFTK